MSEAPKHGRSQPGLMRYPTCLCGAVGLRDDHHDAYYCPIGGAWLEVPCSDKECKFCQRPHPLVRDPHDWIEDEQECPVGKFDKPPHKHAMKCGKCGARRFGAYAEPGAYHYFTYEPAETETMPECKAVRHHPARLPVPVRVGDPWRLVRASQYEGWSADRVHVSFTVPARSSLLCQTPARLTR